MGRTTTLQNHGRDVALVGIGYWGSKLKKYIEESQYFNLKYVCNSKSNLNEVWGDNDVEAVVIATPNSTHYQIAKSALLHNKHVLVEKPLALKVEECEELKQISREKGLTLLVEYVFTFSRALEKAKQIVQKGTIGNVLGIEMSVKHLGRFGGGSVYWLLGSHMLSVLDMFAPLEDLEFRRKDLVVYNGEVESGIISFRGKVDGQIVVSLNHPWKETKVLIYGEGGTIKYVPTVHDSLEVVTYKRLVWTKDLPKNIVSFDIDETSNLRLAMKNFYQCVIGETEDNVDRAIMITRILSDLHK